VNWESEIPLEPAFWSSCSIWLASLEVRFRLANGLLEAVCEDPVVNDDDVVDDDDVFVAEVDDEPLSLCSCDCWSGVRTDSICCWTWACVNPSLCALRTMLRIWVRCDSLSPRSEYCCRLYAA
jgi:hypothetical protein